MLRTHEPKRSLSDRLDWRPGRWTLAALLVVLIVLAAPAEAHGFAF
jgi:hypothetical protein